MSIIVVLGSTAVKVCINQYSILIRIGAAVTTYLFIVTTVFIYPNFISFKRYGASTSRSLFYLMSHKSSFHGKGKN